MVHYMKTYRQEEEKMLFFNIVLNRGKWVKMWAQIVAATHRAARKGLEWATYQSKMQKYLKLFIWDGSLHVYV